MHSKIALLGLGLFVCNPIAFGQSYPSLTSVGVSARVTYDSVAKFFYFSYSLSNDIRNVGSIKGFQVDISRQPNSVPFDTVGLTFAGNSFMERNY